jgi:hypothetical protein
VDIGPEHRRTFFQAFASSRNGRRKGRRSYWRISARRRNGLESKETPAIELYLLSRRDCMCPLAKYS